MQHGGQSPPLDLAGLEEELELDMSHPLPGRARFRVNVFFQRDSIGAVMRVIPMDILPIEKLGIPPVAASFHSSALASDSIVWR